MAFLVLFFFFPHLSSWTKISSGQEFHNTVPAANVGANEWLKISTARCEAICSSLLTLKSLDQILFSPYKFTYSDRLPFIITELATKRKSSWFSEYYKSKSPMGPKKTGAFPLFLFLLHLIYYFHVFIAVFPSVPHGTATALCFEWWLWSLSFFPSLVTAGRELRMLPPSLCFCLRADTCWECFLSWGDPKTNDDIDYSE